MILRCRRQTAVVLPLLALLAGAAGFRTAGVLAVPRQAMLVTVAGTVRDQNGAPVSGAEVRLVQNGSVTANSTTDAGGGYSLAVSPAGPADLAVTKPGYGLGFLRHVLDASTPPGTTLGRFDLAVTADQPAVIPDGQPRLSVPGAANGRVLTPGAATDLTVQVTDSGGAPLPGATVLFIAPAAGPSGTFAGSTQPDGTLVSTVADDGGMATATLTANGLTGPFLVDALVPGSLSATSFAVTVIADGAVPAVAPESARAVAEATLLSGGIEGWTYRLYGPVLLQQGDSVAPAATDSPTLPVPAVVLDHPSWFFWSDDAPLFGFEHPTRFLLVDAAGSGALRYIESTWWPVIAGTGNPQPLALLPPGWTNPAAPAGPPATASAASKFPPDLALSNGARYAASDTPQQPAAQTGAVIIIGADEQQFQNDRETYTNFAKDDLKIPEENIFQHAGPAVTKKDVANLIVQAKLKGIKRLYILISAHGHVEGFDVAAPGSTTPDNVSWDTFGQDLSILSGTGAKVFIVINSCNSGNTLGGLQGYGVDGYIVTSADAQHPTLSFKVPGYLFGSPFVNMFVESFKDAHADPSSDDALSKTMDTLDNRLEEEGWLNFKELSTVGYGRPTEGPLLANANPISALQDITIMQGQPGQISVPRPPSDGTSAGFPSGPVPVLVTLADKQIADTANQFGPTTFTASGNGNGSVYLNDDKPGTISVIGLKPGVTEYTVTYRNAAHSWKGKARITVTAPPGSAPMRKTPPPQVTPIHALFVPSEFATHYSVRAVSPANDALTYVWSLLPPLNDMGCNHFDDGSGHPPATWGATAVWHHADITQKPEDGCHHKTPEHDGVVKVVVSDQHGNAVTCVYFGTNTPPQGLDGPPCQ